MFSTSAEWARLTRTVCGYNPEETQQLSSLAEKITVQLINVQVKGFIPVYYILWMITEMVSGNKCNFCSVAI